MSLAETAGWIAAGIAGAGVVLTIVGRRGKLVDDHPLCAKCRFDLFGLPDDHPRCPECGESLSNPVRKDAIIGNRAKRPMVMWAGVFMVLVVLVPALVVGAGAARGNAYGLQPVFVLTYLAEGPDFRVRTMATKELERRLTVGDLSQDQIDAIADRFIAIHAGEVADFKASGWEISSRMPLESSMIRWLEAANATSKLSPERFSRFVLAVARVTVQVRPRVRRGDPLPIHVSNTVRSSVCSSRYQIEATIDGHPIAMKPSLSSDVSPYLSSIIYFTLPADDPVVASLAPGTHTLEATIAIQIHPPTQRGGPMLAQGTAKSKIEFVVLPADVQSSDGVDVDLAELARRTKLRVRPYAYEPLRADVQLETYSYFEAPSGPQFAGTILASNGEQTRNLGPFFEDGWLGGRFVHAELTGLEGDQLTFYLIPDPAAAAESVTVLKYPNAILQFDGFDARDRSDQTLRAVALPATEENLRRLRSDD